MALDFNQYTFAFLSSCISSGFFASCFRRNSFDVLFLPLFTPAMMMVMYDNETSRSAQPDICCLGVIFSSHSLYLLANAAVLLSTFLPSDYNSTHSHFKSSTDTLTHTHIERFSLTFTRTHQ